MKRPQLTFLAITVVIILFLCGSFVFFGNELKAHMFDDVESRLKDSVEPNLVSFDLQTREQIKKVNTFAQFLGENWDLGKDVHVSLLKSAVKNNGLLRCAIAYPDGSFITHDDKNDGNVSKDAFFIANMRGEFYITDPRPAVVDKTKTVILFTAPVFNSSKEAVGSVIYSYLCDDINKIFNLKAMSGELNLVVAKQSGELLIGNSKYCGSRKNLLSSLRALCTHKYHSPENCLQLIGESGMCQISFEGDRDSVYIRYDKTDYKDWYIIADITESSAISSISYVSNNQRQLSILVAATVIVYIGTILTIWLLQRKLIDSDTGALTVYAFRREAKKIFKRRRNEDYVVVKLDVKDFKLINRIHSFAVGDKVVKNISESLRFVLNDNNSIFARIGVDVFILLLPFQGTDKLGEKRQEFISHFRALMNEGFSSAITFPTGQYVLTSEDYPKPDLGEIFEKVNFAHRAAKQNSDVIIDYEDDIESAALFEKSVEDRMESAIKDEEFTLYLQPKVNIKEKRLCGAEALVRWKVGEKYYMYPTDFVPVLEKNGFIVHLDKYMFTCAVKFIRECLDSGIAPIPISVNFSRHHLSNESFTAELCEIIQKYDVPKKYLEVELTESAFLGNTQHTVKLIEDLHAENLSISIDDFGSGYSCFAQLKDLNVDIIKIDKGFFADTQDESRAEIVIAGILKLAQELGITTVAEGIEQKAQVEKLRELGCDIVQGYYFGKPMPAKELNIEAFIVNED